MLTQTSQVGVEVIMLIYQALVLALVQIFHRLIKATLSSLAGTKHFSVAAPTPWNPLHISISVGNIITFRHKLKPYRVQQERSFADVVSQRKARKARVFMGDSIIRKVDTIVNRGDDITV